jgi:hypothetical protein
MSWRQTLVVRPLALIAPLAIVVAAAASARAQVSSEFLVNTYTTGDQTWPGVVVDSSGNFVVVWQQSQNADMDIHARAFDASGTPLGEATVNTYTTNDQTTPVVAKLGTTGFVVIWNSLLEDGSLDGIFGQRFDASANPVGGEFQVNTYTTGSQAFPAVAGDVSGNFVVVWQSQGQNGPGYGLFGQRFDSTGARVGLEFQVSAFTTGYPGAPSVAMGQSGSFVVAWADYNAYNVFGQRFDGAGARVGGEFQVNTFLPSYMYYPSPAVAASPNGNFVVVWNSYGQDGDASGVFGQRFDAAGARVGSELQVNTYTTSDQTAKSVSIDGSGNFVVVWDSYGQDGSNYGVFAQQFSAAGARVGGELHINTYTTDGQQRSVVAMSSPGHFVVAWESGGQDGSGYGIFAREPGPMSLGRSQLNFGVSRNGSTLDFVTPAQQVTIAVSGVWTASSNQPFLSVTPSGSGSGLLTVQIAGPTGLPATGAAPTATITVNAAGALNSPQTITVNVQVYASGTTGSAAGFFDTPLNNATGVAGAIAVTGWALDDIGVSTVQLWRDPVSADVPGNIGGNGKVFIADALFVNDQRSDIQALNPGAPLNYRGAWGYMLLTNFLPSGPNPVGGNGTFTLYAYAFDIEGHQTPLGSKTITVDNAHATKPFGTIDTPAQGALVSGGLDSFGWALTPQPATIPMDGSTILVFVDGVQLGTAQYNLPRNDIQTLFPGYNNSNGAIGYFHIDTTTLANGVHTIFWVVTDNAAHSDGIGSRFFSVLN